MIGAPLSVLLGAVVLHFLVGAIAKRHDRSK